jgi:aminoglycoside phosphotransferase (APT) family kinase protein
VSEDPRVELVRGIVRSQLPRWRTDAVRRLGAGQDHVAYEVDGLVVRFGASDPAREAALLELGARVSPVAVPRVEFAVAEHGCYAYRRLPGVPLLNVPAPRDVPAIASRLGELLAALHAVPVADVAHLVPTDLQPPAEWLREAAELYPAVAAHVPGAHDRAIRAFLDTPPPEPADAPVFSHNDLGIEHVLIAPASGEVIGVIDWSDAAICDRAYDFGLLLRDLGPAALLAAGMPADDEEHAWFYARCSVIEDLAYGVATGRAEYARKSLDAMDWLFAR